MSSITVGYAKRTESGKPAQSRACGYHLVHRKLVSGHVYPIQHIYPILFGLMYVARMLKEALQRNAIQIWLRLEEKLSAQLTDEVSREVHLYFM